MQHLTFVSGLGIYGKSLEIELDGILEIPFSGGLLGSLKYVFCSIHEDKSLKETVSIRKSSDRFKGNFLHPQTHLSRPETLAGRHRGRPGTDSLEAGDNQRKIPPGSV
jgi:hypothetical protein